MPEVKVVKVSDATPEEEAEFWEYIELEEAIAKAMEEAAAEAA